MEQAVRLLPLCRENLAQFASLLGSREFGGCFCAVWTSFDADWGARCSDPRRPNLEQTRRDVISGRKPGFLVQLGADQGSSQIVGWVGAGPRTEFPLLATKLGSRLAPQISQTWAIGCLALSGGFRGQGLATAVVSAVLRRAQRGGATAVEAYPVRPWDEPRSYRGSWRLYDRLGFRISAAEPDDASEVLLMSIGLT